MSILDEIVENKKDEISKLKKLFSKKYFEGIIKDAKGPKDFAKAIKNPVSLIAEIKKASPSAGIIRRQFYPIKIAEIYEKVGASAVSVLTDEKYFLGNIKYLKDISNAVSIPALRKDFIIDEIQIYESRANGADAILLIAGILSRDELRQFSEIADGLGMTQILEVHDEKELLKALEISPKIIGINNRDLNTFKTDINTTRKLIKLIPKDKRPIIVSESGIKTKKDIDSLKKSGANAVLIGEELMKAENPEKKIRELFND